MEKLVTAGGEQVWQQGKDDIWRGITSLRTGKGVWGKLFSGALT